MCPLHSGWIDKKLTKTIFWGVVKLANTGIASDALLLEWASEWRKGGFQLVTVHCWHQEVYPAMQKFCRDQLEHQQDDCVCVYVKGFHRSTAEGQNSEQDWNAGNSHISVSSVKKSVGAKGDSRHFQPSVNDCIWLAKYDFLLVFHSAFRSMKNH